MSSSRPASPRLLVIKVGGSLFGWPAFPAALRGFLDAHASDRLVLIAGGGAIVDSLRELDRVHGLGEVRSHALALRAMDLSSHIVAALASGLVVIEAVDGLSPAWERGETPVLAPRLFLDAEDRSAPDPLPHRWDVTSDSIAARLAARLGADELVLLKSVSAPRGLDLAAAAAAGLVDPAFPAAARPIPRVSLVNLRDRDADATLLA